MQVNRDFSVFKKYSKKINLMKQNRLELIMSQIFETF